jgi:hypothetical protein
VDHLRGVSALLVEDSVGFRRHRRPGLHKLIGVAAGVELLDRSQLHNHVPLFVLIIVIVLVALDQSLWVNFFLGLFRFLLTAKPGQVGGPPLLENLSFLFRLTRNLFNCLDTGLGLERPNSGVYLPLDLSSLIGQPIHREINLVGEHEDLQWKLVSPGLTRQRVS